MNGRGDEASIVTKFDVFSSIPSDHTVDRLPSLVSASKKQRRHAINGSVRRSRWFRGVQRALHLGVRLWKGSVASFA